MCSDHSCIIVMVQEAEGTSRGPTAVGLEGTARKPWAFQTELNTSGVRAVGTAGTIAPPFQAAPLVCI